MQIIKLQHFYVKRREIRNVVWPSTFSTKNVYVIYLKNKPQNKFSTSRNDVHFALADFKH